MKNDRSVSKSINIHASAEQVWDALVNPEKIKFYLMGTQTITDWKAGSSISFIGDYRGHEYYDKGNVLTVVPSKLLKYNYFSGFFGLEDKIENYFIVTLTIDTVDHETVSLTWTQENIHNKQTQEHTEDGLPDILKQIKELVEKS